MSNKAVVHLRVYQSNGRDNNISFNADGSVQNDTILVKLTHNTLEWANFIKNARYVGFIDAKVEKVIGETDFASIEKEVDKAMNPVVEVVLSPEQKKIADLEAKLDALVNNSSPEIRKATPNEEKAHDEKWENVSEEETLESVKVEYQRVMGKKPFHKWTIEQLKEKMKNK